MGKDLRLENMRAMPVRSTADMADTHQQTLGQLIRQARTDEQLALRELARRVDIKPSYLSDIENDRRVPAEGVLRRVSEQLPALDFDDLMGRAGRFGQDAERYIRSSPAATTLFRKMQEHNLSDHDVRELLKRVENPSAGKGRKK